MRTSLIIVLLVLAAVAVAQLNSAVIENKGKIPANSVITYESGLIQYKSVKPGSKNTVENKVKGKADPIKRMTFNVNGTTSSLYTPNDPAAKPESRFVTIDGSKKARVTARK